MYLSSPGCNWHHLVQRLERDHTPDHQNGIIMESTVYQNVEQKQLTKKNI